MVSEGSDPVWFWDEWQAFADGLDAPTKGWAA